MVNEMIKNILSQVPHFYFLPNRGNLGDVVIATSEYQFFNDNNYNYTVMDTQNIPQDDFTLVYGGGGLWTKYYDFSNVTDIFKLKNIKKIIILPSSFNECDNLFDVVDERFTIFCREEKSYNYCLSKNKKAEFILSNDMALGLNIDFYKNLNKKCVKNIDSNLVKDVYNKLYLPYKNIFKFIPDIFKNITYKSNKAIGYFLRHDVESKNDWSNFDIKLNEDLSQILGSYCIDSSFSVILTKIFLSMIDTVDIVVTDRLHVGICGYLLNKEVILIDNSYGKLSSVYNYSLESYKNVHLISPEQIDETINNIIEDVNITRKTNINAPSKFYSFLSEYILNRNADDKFENIMWSNVPQNKIKRFIECLLPITACNLKCHYCYVIQNNYQNNEIPKFNYSPEHIAKALSKNRLGGTCLISIYGAGETLLSENIIPVIFKLLEEGHYINITTNGTLKKRFSKFLDLPLECRSRLHFSFSLHYLELKRLSLLETFFNNVKMMKDNGFSILVQFNMCDEYMPYLDAIKDLCYQYIGAYPQVALTRDEKSGTYKIFSKLSLHEYYLVGKQFNSLLWECTNRNFLVKRSEYCYAGDWSFRLNICTGDIKRCYFENESQNIYQDLNKPISFIPLGKTCGMEYCTNSSHFISLGTIPAIEMESYGELRNRSCSDGTEWLNSKTKEFFNSKLEESNFNPLKIEKYGY